MSRTKLNSSLTERVLAQINKAASSSKKKGCAKAGRNSTKCSYYRSSRYRNNKLKGLNAHLSIHVNDSCAITALERLKATI
jgi:hypothetical protein